MLRKRFLWLAAAAVLTGVAGLAWSQMAATAPSKDIVATAIAAGQFKTLTKLLYAAGLVETLKGKGPFTVFAPTDEAFAKLPKETLENLQMPENKEKLKAILTYHVAPGMMMASDVAKAKTIKTVNGKEITVTMKDMEVFVDGAKVATPDVMASNGVIHVIDKVIMPKD